MNREKFSEKYGTIISEMTEYWDSDEATGREVDDFNLAQRWLIEQYGLPLSSNIAHLRSIIPEAREILDQFDMCAPFVIEHLNLGRTNTPKTARALLEKMIPIWEAVLTKVELKWREQGGSDAHGTTC